MRKVPGLTPRKRNFVHCRCGRFLAWRSLSLTSLGYIELSDCRMAVSEIIGRFSDIVRTNEIYVSILIGKLSRLKVLWTLSIVILYLRSNKWLKWPSHALGISTELNPCFFALKYAGKPPLLLVVEGKLHFGLHYFNVLVSGKSTKISDSDRHFPLTTLSNKMISNGNVTVKWKIAIRVLRVS